MFKKSLIAVAALLAAAGTAQACSTLVIGKAVSETGNIIVAHNEDNGGRLFNMQHYVAPATHKKGEMIKFEKFAAEIPQVEKTLGFYWTQTFVPDGASFADGFMNDAGVVVATNWCGEIFEADRMEVKDGGIGYGIRRLVAERAHTAREGVEIATVVVATNWCGEIFEADRMEVKDGGIGYGIRRLVAERAHTAREGVEIATQLLKEFGYFHDGRTYTIADANEAWQLAIHQGNSWVARKIQDDEVVYIPNNFMMDKVDLNDKNTWLIEPNQVERAIKDGRHDAIPNNFMMDKVDLNDKNTWLIEPNQVERAIKDGRHDAKNPIFNWRKVVAQESVRHERWNANRNVLAWKFLTGKEYNDPEQFPYSAKIDRKLGVKDAIAFLRLHEDYIRKLGVKDAIAFLRLHEDYIGQDQELYHSKSEGICRTTSHDSIVYNLTKDPTLTEAWKTLGRPCQSVYIPLYPLAGPAEGTAFTDPITATKEHFARPWVVRASPFISRFIRSLAPLKARLSPTRSRLRRNTSRVPLPCLTSVLTLRRTLSLALATTPSTTSVVTKSLSVRP